MAAGLSLGLNLISIVLFLLPGLVGVKLGLWYAKRADWFNRIDTIALSFGVSLFSLVFIYTLHSRLHGDWLKTSEVAAAWIALPSGLFVYIQLVVLSSLMGLLLGAINFGGDIVAKRSGIWNKFFVTIDSESDSEQYQVRVRMQSGDELWGRVEDKGEIGANRDILLERPRRIIRREDGSIGEAYSYTGYAYLHNEDISHIEFDSLSDADIVQGPGDDDAEPESDEEIQELEEFAGEGDVRDDTESGESSSS